MTRGKPRKMRKRVVKKKKSSGLGTDVKCVGFVGGLVVMAVILLVVIIPLAQNASWIIQHQDVAVNINITDLSESRPPTFTITRFEAGDDNVLVNDTTSWEHGDGHMLYVYARNEAGKYYNFESHEWQTAEYTEQIRVSYPEAGYTLNERVGVNIIVTIKVLNIGQHLGLEEGEIYHRVVVGTIV